MNNTPSIIPRMAVLVAGLAAAAIAGAQPAATPTNPSSSPITASRKSVCASGR
jgi:hypothetical protein